MNTLLPEIEKFAADTGLSDHRIGILLAGNGRLLPRLRNGGRIWPDTAAKVLENLQRQRGLRSPSGAEAERDAA